MEEAIKPLSFQVDKMDRAYFLDELIDRLSQPCLLTKSQAVAGFKRHFVL